MVLTEDEKFFIYSNSRERIMQPLALTPWKKTGFKKIRAVPKAIENSNG